MPDLRRNSNECVSGPDIERGSRDDIALVLCPIHDPHLVDKRIAAEFMNGILAGNKVCPVKSDSACAFYAINGIDGLIRDVRERITDDLKGGVAHIPEIYIVISLGNVIAEVAIAIREVKGEERGIPDRTTFYRIRR